MKITTKEYDLIIGKGYELFLEEQEGKISLEEFYSRSDSLLDRILSSENVHQFSEFEDFERSFADSISRGYRRHGEALPTNWRDFVLGEARHEREHTDVSLRYGLKPTYCFMHNDHPTPGSWQPFNYVREKDILKKGWDDYMRFKYMIDTASAPRNLSPKDKEFLNVLDGIVVNNERIDIPRKRELLGMIGKGLRK